MTASATPAALESSPADNTAAITLNAKGATLVDGGVTTAPTGAIASESNVQYTFNVTSTGEVTARKVAFRHHVDVQALKFVSAQVVGDSSASCVAPASVFGNTIPMTCQLGDMAKGVTKSVQVTYTTKRAGMVKTTYAAAQGAPYNAETSGSFNASHTLEVKAPDLLLQQVAYGRDGRCRGDGQRAVQGHQHFARSLGPERRDGVRSHQRPDGRLVAGTQTNCSKTSDVKVVCVTGAMAPEANATRTSQWQGVKVGTYTMKVTAEPAASDLEPADNVDTITVEVVGPDLTVSIVQTPAAPVARDADLTYQIEVSNSGDGISKQTTLATSVNDGAMLYHSASVSAGVALAALT